MIIQGLQKMTLLDYPEHVACTVFLAGCDFRCPFCHNYELVDPSFFGKDEKALAMEGMTGDKFLDFLSTRKGLLDGVAITGGEPCLRDDLPDFIADIRDAGFQVKLDTNGNHPEMLRKLLDQRLVNFVSMDIKNSPAKYAKTTGLMGIDMDSIKESIQLLINGETPYEFRTTVISQFHEAGDFREIGELIRGAKKYYLQPFLEKETVPDRTLTAPALEEMREYLNIVFDFVEFASLRGIDE